MRLLGVVTLLLVAAMEACTTSPTATLQPPGSARTESTPAAPLPSDTTSATRGPNGFGSGN